MARGKAYREAEQKISKAVRSGAIELDLSGAYAKGSPKLTELPEALGKLVQLQSLDLFGNDLTAVPDWLGGLAQLQSLNLNTNQLTALPEGLCRLTQLQWLDLRGNQLTALPEGLCRLTQLQSLDLRGNQLTALPEGLGRLTQLQSLDLSGNKLTELPEGLGRLKKLRSLDLSHNQLMTAPESLGQLTHLQTLRLGYNRLRTVPKQLAQLKNLEELELRDNPLGKVPEPLRALRQVQTLYLHNCDLPTIPDWIGELRSLDFLGIGANKLTELPASLAQLQELTTLFLGYEKGGGNLFDRLPECLRGLKKLESLVAVKCKLTDLPDWLLELPRLGELLLEDNPLNPELAAANEEGLDAVKRYLRAKAQAQVVVNEAKLILVGEGEVGKSCLLGALRGDPWEEGRPTTHGIEIKPVKVTDTSTGTEITLNGWDFGGQRVYRPTHQLFFSAPAIYLVVWKPREGPQQGLVKEWITLVKHRAPDAKILVVATHGGPKERQPDIDRQEIWDLFGKDMVLDFFLVESKPNPKTAERSGIAELRQAIARAAASLPEMGRTVPKQWEDTRHALKETGAAYLPLQQVLKFCRDRKMDDELASDFVRNSHRRGHLIHYEHDPLLRDVVVLKPDWLSTAISFVLDDKVTREAHGLVDLTRLSQLWDDPERPGHRYPADLHAVFLRLMERFDLSYRLAEPPKGKSGGSSLIAQLVPDVRPTPMRGWPAKAKTGDGEQSQICRIVDIKAGQSGAAEGLFFQLIVRLHKYSLGRAKFAESVHWQRGLVLEDDYGARALLEHVGSDVRITVRSPYPERFLSALTYEAKWLVESFWTGLRCDVMVPCTLPCGRDAPGTGLFEVEKLVAFKRQGMQLFPCIASGCSQAQDIDGLLRNAPAVRRIPIEVLLAEGFDQMRSRLDSVREQLVQQDHKAEDRFRVLDRNDRRIVSQVEDAFTGLMQALIDEAKDGPRLFTFEPVDPGFFDRPKWLSQKFRVTLWCEHARLPLTALNGSDKRGVYELTMPREWVVKAAPFLKVLAGTLSLVVPVASSATKLVLEDTLYKSIEKQLDVGQKTLDSVLKGGKEAGEWIAKDDAPALERSGGVTRAEGAVLRQLHAWLKEKDPSFGGLVRVQNRRREFLWVHPQFAPEY